MKITESNRAAEYIAELRERSRKRTGVHVSDVLYCLRKTFFRRTLGTESTRRQELLYVTGTAIHYYLQPEQGETSIELDGLSASPDVLDGEEIKSTRMSAGKFVPSDQPKWIAQMMAYCKALRRKKFELVVFFICGDYKPPFPDLKSWSFEFTQSEIDENWKRLVKRKDALVVALEKGDVSGLESGEDWECKECECAIPCETARTRGAVK